MLPTEWVPEVFDITTHFNKQMLTSLRFQLCVRTRSALKLNTSIVSTFGKAALLEPRVPSPLLFLCFCFVVVSSLASGEMKMMMMTTTLLSLFLLTDSGVIDWSKWVGAVRTRNGMHRIGAQTIDSITNFNAIVLDYSTSKRLEGSQPSEHLQFSRFKFCTIPPVKMSMLNELLNSKRLMIYDLVR